MQTTQFKLGPLGQIARAVENLARAQAWYTDVLGLPHLYTYGKLAFFDDPGRGRPAQRLRALFPGRRHSGRARRDGLLPRLGRRHARHHVAGETRLTRHAATDARPSTPRRTPPPSLESRRARAAGPLGRRLPAG